MTSKQLLEVLFEGDHVEQGASRFDVDEEIDVAVRSSISSGHRPEHVDISGAMARRQLKNRPPVCVHRIVRHA